MTANKTDGSNEDIDTHFPNTFNSSHSKAKNNIIFGDFKKYEDKTNGVLSTKYKAFRQLFCTNIEYKNILVETILKQQNENHAEKKIISSINCQE